jgi:hypothetical protein
LSSASSILTNQPQPHPVANSTTTNSLRHVLYPLSRDEAAIAPTQYTIETGGAMLSFAGINNPDIEYTAGNADILSSTIAATHDPTSLLQHDELHGREVAPYSDLLRLEYHAAAYTGAVRGSLALPEFDLRSNFASTTFPSSTISPTINETVLEGNPPKDDLGDGFSEPQRPDIPATDYSGSRTLSQQILESLAIQNNNNFLDQSQMQSQMVMQQQVFPNMILGGTSSHLPMNVQATQRTPCSFCTETFARPSDLERHWRSVHLGIKHHCYCPGCPNNHGKGYCRLEKLRTH